MFSGGIFVPHPVVLPEQSSELGQIVFLALVGVGLGELMSSPGFVHMLQNQQQLLIMSLAVGLLDVRQADHKAVFEFGEVHIALGLLDRFLKCLDQ